MIKFTNTMTVLNEYLARNIILLDRVWKGYRSGASAEGALIYEYIQNRRVS